MSLPPRTTPRPRLPRAPRGFPGGPFMDLFIQSLENTFRSYDNPGPGIHARLQLTDLPDTGDGLRVGDIFSNGGVLTIVRENDIFLGTVSSVVSLGELTVTTA